MANFFTALAEFILPLLTFPTALAELILPWTTVHCSGRINIALANFFSTALAE